MKEIIYCYKCDCGHKWYDDYHESEKCPTCGHEGKVEFHHEENNTNN